MLRLLICDDAPDAREAVKVSLAEQQEIEVVGEAENGEEASRRLRRSAPRRHPDGRQDAGPRRHRGDEADPRPAAEGPDRRLRGIGRHRRRDGDARGGRRRVLPEGSSAVGARAGALQARASRSSGWRIRSPARRAAAAPPISLRASSPTSPGRRSRRSISRRPKDLSRSPPWRGRTRPSRCARRRTSSPARTRSSASSRRTHTSWASSTGSGAACTQAIAVPLIADAQALGAVLVALPPSVQAFGDPELVAGVADLAAESLANERRLALTHAEARRDALTGLANKRAFDEHLEKVSARPASEASRISLVILDLDDFKQVNDREGHLAGDEVLRAVGRILMRVVRTEDEVFRIGGEEFALVVEGPSAAAVQVADRVRNALAQKSARARVADSFRGRCDVPRSCARCVRSPPQGRHRALRSEIRGQGPRQGLQARGRAGPCVERIGRPRSSDQRGPEAARRRRRRCPAHPSAHDLRGGGHRGRRGRLPPRKRRTRSRAARPTWSSSTSACPAAWTG